MIELEAALDTNNWYELGAQTVACQGHDNICEREYISWDVRFEAEGEINHVASRHEGDDPPRCP